MWTSLKPQFTIKNCINYLQKKLIFHSNIVICYQKQSQNIVSKKNAHTTFANQENNGLHSAAIEQLL